LATINDLAVSVSPLHVESVISPPFGTQDRRGNRSLRAIWHIARAVVAVALVLVVGVMAMMGVAQLRARNGVTVVLNHAVLTVLSGSMKPIFAPGDVIVDRPLKSGEASQLHAGEIVTFREPGTSPTSGPLVTHRIIGVITGPSAGTATTTTPAAAGTGASNVAYQTRGDNNNVADPWKVAPSDIIGVYQRHIPKVGYLIQDLHSRWAVVVALILAFVWIGEGEFRKRWRKAGEPPASSDGPSRAADDESGRRMT
jgi:signal peptidase